MTIWYVRPESFATGDDDGTSYANAWQGIGNIVWGGAGVDVGLTEDYAGTTVTPPVDIGGYESGYFYSKGSELRMFMDMTQA